MMANNKERMELIASDPKMYLDIIQNYKKMPDDKEVYLPDLFNILVNREGDGRLKVKFKMSDDTQWYDVGYEGGSFTDQDVYKLFTDKVTNIIKHPPPDRRAMLENTLLPGGRPAPPMRSQGNQSKLTKIDRFLGRTSHAYEETDPDSFNTSYSISTPACVPAAAANSLAPAKLPLTAPESPEKLPLTAPESPAKLPLTAPESPEKLPLAPKLSALADDSFLSSVIDSYKAQLKERLRDKSLNNIDPTLLELAQLCPDSCKNEFTSLASLISNNGQFVSKALDVMPQLSPGKQHLLLDFLLRHNKVHTHDELCDILELSPKDRGLLSQYEIRLDRL
jgi:hypothetical protein